MNMLHCWLCQSDWWRGVVKQRVPWALEDVEMGANVLEVGPGFGVTTDLIHESVRSMTCVEIDPRLAEGLSHRMSGRNVRVLCEDATSMSPADASFDSAVCFTMLHHVPSPGLQDRLLAEVNRVLKPGGVFAGSDSLTSWRFRLLHVFDTMVMVDPQTLPARLEAAGFVEVHVEADTSAFRFRARKPMHANSGNRKPKGDQNVHHE